ncbi:olfactory receptor 5V1-like [Pelobates fuscus]|uniref:olfactory receptor 5V1-like n=1 Tax=Pelobates fuscus TaxID=191477 RepID=UPI002FE4624E
MAKQYRMKLVPQMPAGINVQQRNLHPHVVFLSGDSNLLTKVESDGLLHYATKFVISVMDVVRGDRWENNQTEVNEFILLGFLHISNWKCEMFIVFLIIFLMTLIGNSLIILAIKVNVELHSPMYFFLGNLSFLEICYTSITIPNILSDILQNSIVISYAGCMTQVYFFTFCATAECILLAAMACDRYVAICQPLRYTTIINRTVCNFLSAFALLSGLLNSTINTPLTASLMFCGVNAIDRLYCEVQPLIRLSCADTSLNDIFVTASAAVFGVSCLIFILTSYIFIVSAILRIPRQKSQHKSFSTCASHITVVILYYGSLIFMYLLPISWRKLDFIGSMIYSIFTPMLNPIIYSLRNRKVKQALAAVFIGLCAPLTNNLWKIKLS